MNQDALFHKIRSLLRKAESTTHEQEAISFIAKAQELMMRHAIDEETLWRNDPERRSKIGTTDIEIPDKKQGSQEKRNILHVIARANRCRMWYTPKASVSTIAGFPADRAFVEMLYRSIMVQMNFKQAVEKAMSPHVHPKAFNTAFMVGFERTITARITSATIKSDSVIYGEPGNSLVLADRKAAVDRWVEQNTHLGKGSQAKCKSLNADAYNAGVRSAATTDISGGRGTIPSNRPKRKELT